MNAILIAEDEKRIASFVEKGLRSNGFTPQPVNGHLKVSDPQQVNGSEEMTPYTDINFEDLDRKDI